MSLTFEWDEEKAAANWRKHHVSFGEAATSFGDPKSLTIHDPDHSSLDEDRFILIGMSARGRLLLVVHAERADNIRVISAREATRRERKSYEEG